jgi:hypothetical protein
LNAAGALREKGGNGGLSGSDSFREAGNGTKLLNGSDRCVARTPVRLSGDVLVGAIGKAAGAVNCCLPPTAIEGLIGAMSMPVRVPPEELLPHPKETRLKEEHWQECVAVVEQRRQFFWSEGGCRRSITSRSANSALA